MLFRLFFFSFSGTNNNRNAVPTMYLFHSNIFSVNLFTTFFIFIHLVVYRTFFPFSLLNVYLRLFNLRHFVIYSSFQDNFVFFLPFAFEFNQLSLFSSAFKNINVLNILISRVFCFNFQMFA